MYLQSGVYNLLLYSYLAGNPEPMSKPFMSWLELQTLRNFPLPFLVQLNWVKDRRPDHVW